LVSVAVHLPLWLGASSLDLLSVRLLGLVALEILLLSLDVPDGRSLGLSSLDLLKLSVRLLRALVALGVFLLSLDAPEGRLLDLVHLRLTDLGLMLALVGGVVLLLGGLLVGASEGAGILEGIGVLGGIGIVGVGVVATGVVVAMVGVVVAALVWVGVVGAVAASVADWVHGCLMGGGWLRSWVKRWCWLSILKKAIAYRGLVGIGLLRFGGNGGAVELLDCKRLALRWWW
jgi:hypothetical protein